MFALVDRILLKIRRAYYRRVFRGTRGVSAPQDVVCLGRVHFFGNPDVEVGAGVRLWPGVSFAGDGRIVIGDNVSVGKDCSFYAAKQGGIVLGDDVAVGAQTYIIDSNHGTELGTLIRNQPLHSQAVVIGDDVWIAANCSIVKGAAIGKGAVIGAGAVVNSHIPEREIAVGVPARVIRQRGLATFE